MTTEGTGDPRGRKGPQLSCHFSVFLCVLWGSFKMKFHAQRI
jgi:hypothetical protein